MSSQGPIAFLGQLWRDPRIRLFAVLVIFSLLAFRLGFDSSLKEPPPNGGLKIPANSLDFGEVWARGKLELPIPLQNTGPNSIDVRGFSFSCTCLKVEPDSFIMGPNEKKLVKVTIDLSERSSNEIDLKNREIQVSLSPIINGGPVFQNGWTLHGRVKRPFVLTPNIVEFDGCIRGQTQPSQIVFLTEDVPIATISCELDETLASAETLGVKNKSGKYEIRISPRKWLPVGPFSFPVNINATTKDGAVIPSVALFVKGKMKEEVEATPASLSLGARRLGETITETIILGSLGSHQFDILKTTVSSKSIEAKIQSSSGSDIRVHITWRISKAGENKETISFMVRSSDRTFEVLLRADAYGY